MSLKIEDFFPFCSKEDCPQANSGPHKHVLKFQREFLTASEKFLAMVGGYGSGKTLPACALGNILSLKVEGNRGIVCRRSYSKLHDSTETVFLEVLDRIGVPYDAYEVRDHWPHRLILFNGSEVFFRETKDLGRFLGPEYGWYYIDEAVEEPEKTFKDLTGRLRLGRAKDYLKGFLTTNPPNTSPHNPHWIENLFGRESGLKVHTSPDGGKTAFRQWRMATMVNPFLPKDYVKELLLTHTAQEVRRILYGDYTTVFEGKPVYPQFQYSKHVGEPDSHMMTVVRVWDFGFHVPACTWHQFIRCKAGKIHWHVLHEFVGRDIEALPFATEVLRQSLNRFPNHPSLMFADGGDTAGAQVSDKGPGPIILLSRPPYGLQFRHKKFPDITVGLDLVRGALREKCACGHYIFLVHRDCRNVIETLAGGYHYAALKPGKEEKPKPVKDGFYDNVADTIRYAGELFYRPATRDPSFMDDLAKAGMVAGEIVVATEQDMQRWMGEWPSEGKTTTRGTPATLTPSDGGVFV